MRRKGTQQQYSFLKANMTCTSILLMLFLMTDRCTSFGCHAPPSSYRQRSLHSNMMQPDLSSSSSVPVYDDNIHNNKNTNIISNKKRQKKKNNSKQYIHRFQQKERTPKITVLPEQVEEQLKQALATLHKISRTVDDYPNAETTRLVPFPTVRDCNAALAAFGDAGDLLRALQLFGKMRKAAAYPNLIVVPTPTLVTYSTLMSRAVKFSKPLVALRLWDLMIQQQRSPISKVLAIPMEEIDVKAANIRMNCFAKLADVTQAQNLLHQMISGDGPDVPRLQPNIVTYNTLLHACQRAGDLDSALDVVRRMHHCRPDARTYTSLIATVARNKSTSAGRNDPSLAFALLEEMKGRGIRPNGITYSALIDACGRCRRPDLALQGLRIMLLQKAQEAESLSKMKDPKVKIYTLSDEVGAWTAAINACGKAGRIQTALRLFRAMPGFGVMPNTITCGSLTDSLLRTGATAETLDVLRYMKKNGIVPSEVMYTSLITRAESLAKMERDGESFSIPSQAHFVALDSQHTEEQQINDARAIDVYTELIKSLVEGDRSSTKVPLQWKNTRLAEQSPKTVRGDDVLIKVFLVFQEMKSAGTMPDLACYNALLRACARAGDFDHAHDVLRQMLAADLCPNDTSWRQLLQAAVQQKDGERALQAWKQGVEYSKERRRKRAFADEPNVPTWKPSASSLAALLSALLAEATGTSISDEKKIVLYRKVVEVYDKVLLGDEKMGFDRMDLDMVLGNQRVVILFIRGMLGLSDLEDDPASLDNQRLTVRSILELGCVSKNDENYRLPWAVRETLNKAVAFSRIA